METALEKLNYRREEKGTLIATGMVAILTANKTAIMLNALSAAERKLKDNFTFFISW